MWKPSVAGVLAVSLVAGLVACTLPTTTTMTKLVKAAPVCRTVETWMKYRAALEQGSAGIGALRALTESGECAEMAAGTIVREISLSEKLPEDSVAVRLEKWEQPGTGQATSGVTFRSNLHSWKFKQTGSVWKFWD